MEKICTTCHVSKDRASGFRLIRMNKNGTPLYGSECFDCGRKGCRERHRSKPIEERKAIYQRVKARGTDEKRKAVRLKSKYGLTLEAFQEMLDAQKSACFICSLPITGKEVMVDHCHASGKIRKLLCRSCNTGLGNFKDNRTIMIKALQYIEEHNPSVH